MRFQFHFTAETSHERQLPYASKWMAWTEVVLSSTLLIVFFLFFLFCAFQPASSMAMLMFLAVMTCGCALWFCNITFVFHTFNKNRDLWIFFGRPIVDHGVHDLTALKFLFMTPPKPLEYPLSLKIHHNLCRLLLLLMPACFVAIFMSPT